MTIEETLKIFKSGYIFEYSRVSSDEIRRIDEAVQEVIATLEQKLNEDINEVTE